MPIVPNPLIINTNDKYILGQVLKFYALKTTLL